METDLRQLFEASFEGEPPLPSPEERVRAGRRALRRRRVVVTGVAAAAVAVIGVGAAQLGGSSDAPPAPIDQPSSPTTETTLSAEETLTRAVPVDDGWRQDCDHAGQPTCAAYVVGAAPVGMRDDGTVVRTGSDVVIDLRSRTTAGDDGGRMVALEVRTPASIHSRWHLLVQDADGKVTASVADPSTSQISFEEWVAAITHGRDVPGAPDLTRERVIVGG